MQQPSTLEEVIRHHKEQGDKGVQAFKRDLQKMRSGRASASLLEGVFVEYYGSRTALTHLAQVTSPEARTIVVQVYDQGAVESVEKAIRTSDLGFNPSREGNVLRIIVPPLTEESRKEIVKHLHKAAEEHRVSIRNHRRESNDFVKKFEKDGTVTKDDAKRGMDKIQKQTDSSIEEIDSLLKVKEAEIMEV